MGNYYVLTLIEENFWIDFPLHSSVQVSFLVVNIIIITYTYVNCSSLLLNNMNNKYKYVNILENASVGFDHVFCWISLVQFWPHTILLYIYIKLVTNQLQQIMIR